VIAKAEVFPIILAACPSFRARYEASVAEDGADLLYIHAGALAAHLLALHRAGDREEFPAVGAAIERLHTDGDHSVRELMTIGVLEGIQNVWGNSGAQPDQFLPFLGPLSTTAWHDLNRFWAGEIPYVPDTKTPN
jgi:hypothetical protein